MKITSQNFRNNEKIPVKFTCDGEDINPNLTIEEVPPAAKSLVLIMDDPDAPAGLWTHWIVWNIYPKTKMIKENEVPEGGTEGKNTSRSLGYQGPCPPRGTHRYFFRIYALDCLLNLGVGSARQELDRTIEGHILEKAELIGLFR